MKLALLIDANPRLLRGPGTKCRLRAGKWKFKVEGVVDSVLAIYHSLLESEDKNFARHSFSDDLSLKGPAHCFVEILQAGSEKKISVYALSE